MKKLIILFFVLSLAFAVGIFAHNDPGYVLFYYRHWSLETTLWFFLIALLLFILLLFWLVALWRGVGNISNKFNSWRNARRLNKAICETNKGLIELVVGKWSSAEKRLIRYAERDDSFLLNCFAAAFAAQKQHNFKARDLYLRTAKQSAPEQEKTILFANARLQIIAQQYDAAQTTLLMLRDSYGDDAGLLSLLMELYKSINNWQELLVLLPAIKKYKVLPKENFIALEKKVYVGIFKFYLQENELSLLFEIYNSMSRHLRDDSELNLLYIKALLAEGDFDKAEKLIAIQLGKNWSAELIKLYGDVNHDHAYKQMQKAEKWLKQRENDLDLLFALAKICRRQQLWGKAQDYLSQVIAVQPSSEVYREMAEIMCALKHNDEAIKYFRLALS